MINNLSGDAFTDKPFFDRDFIKRNRIKSLEGQYSRKKDGDVVRPSSDFFKFTFEIKLTTIIIKKVGNPTSYYSNHIQFTTKT
jgi:hypothetical protein